MKNLEIQTLSQHHQGKANSIPGYECYRELGTLIISSCCMLHTVGQPLSCCMLHTVGQPLSCCMLHTVGQPLRCCMLHTVGQPLSCLHAELITQVYKDRPELHHSPFIRSSNSHSARPSIKASNNLELSLNTRLMVWTLLPT